MVRLYRAVYFTLTAIGLTVHIIQIIKTWARLHKNILTRCTKELDTGLCYPWWTIFVWIMETNFFQLPSESRIEVTRLRKIDHYTLLSRPFLGKFSVTEKPPKNQIFRGRMKVGTTGFEPVTPAL